MKYEYVRGMRTPAEETEANFNRLMQLELLAAEIDQQLREALPHAVIQERSLSEEYRRIVVLRDESNAAAESIAQELVDNFGNRQVIVFATPVEPPSHLVPVPVCGRSGCIRVSPRVSDRGTVEIITEVFLRP